jgi:CRP-like cAMP-binding protein
MSWPARLRALGRAHSDFRATLVRDRVSTRPALPGRFVRRTGTCQASNLGCGRAVGVTHRRPLVDGNPGRTRRALFARWTRTNQQPRAGSPTPPSEVPGPMTSPNHRRIPDCPDCPSDSFWAALTPIQQQLFTESAVERVFAAGATLMEEGETADHVIVILSGRTKICIEDNGAEQIIAKRGPGELVGERAALRVSVRSATVVALEQVRALVVTTQDFATFLSKHPGVLHLVEDQIYERLTKDSARRYKDHFHHAWEVGRAMVPRFGRLTPIRLAGENCTVVFTDVVAFGARTRSDEHRRIIRRELLQMTFEALRAVWEQSCVEDRGDGHLIVVPPAVPTGQVLRSLFIALPSALQKHNDIYAAGARIQLKIALDVGPVTGDDSGVSGRAIINSARFLDAPPFKEAMAANRATLGFVVSDFVFQSAVSQAECLTDPAHYSGVDVRVKETFQRAWMLLVNPSTPALPPHTALVSGRPLLSQS